MAGWSVQKQEYTYIESPLTSGYLGLFLKSKNNLGKSFFFGTESKKVCNFNVQAIPKWKKYWKLLQKKDAKETEETRNKLNFERRFLKNMINKYLHILYQIQVSCS